MKIYLVKRKKTNFRWFDNETDLTNFFINAPESLDSYQVTILNAEVDSEMTGDKLFNAIKEQSVLDTKLNVVLGDDYAQKVQNFIKAFEQWCPKTPWDKTKMTTDGLKVYEKLTTVPAEEKQFSKAFTSCSEYLVYTIGSGYVDTSEWFKILIDIYPKILTKGLAETCQIEYVDPVTRGTRYTGQRTPTTTVKSFEKAKKLIEKERKAVEKSTK
jgi:hypothetical protein